MFNTIELSKKLVIGVAAFLSIVGTIVGAIFYIPECYADPSSLLCRFTISSWEVLISRVEVNLGLILIVLGVLGLIISLVASYRNEQEESKNKLQDEIDRKDAILNSKFIPNDVQINIIKCFDAMKDRRPLPEDRLAEVLGLGMSELRANLSKLDRQGLVSIYEEFADGKYHTYVAEDEAFEYICST